MRRFVQAFGFKRDKHDHRQANDPHKPAGNGPRPSLKPLLTLPLKPRQPSVPDTTNCSPSSSFSTPNLSEATSSDPHSSASSSGSTNLSIQTPDDDHSIGAPLARTQTKRSWKSWIGKRSASLKHRDRGDNAATTPQLPDWDPHALPVVPPLAAFTTQYTDDEMHSSPLSECSRLPSPDPAPFAPSPALVSSPASARANLRVLVKNGLVLSPHPAPFVQPVAGPIYPRSCNRVRVNTRRPSLHGLMLRKRLLRRIEDPTQDLSPLEQASITPFGLQPTPVELDQPSVLEYDVPYPDKTITVLSSCPGLRRWICRPCFEDRFVIYLASDAGEIVCKPVSSAFAVAALEYSEVLDVMVDPDFVLPSDKATSDAPSSLSESSPSPTPPPEPSPSASTLQVAPSASFTTRRNSYTTIPSPLRNEHNASPSMASTAEVHTAQPTPAVVPKKAATPVKRVVRFAEDDDDDDDGVPLHLLRMKKKKEEKAKFLRAERQRRMREALVEQQRKEAEAYEREKRRQIKERERQEYERRLYAEQVAASRQRSEQSRAGAYTLPSSSSNSLLVPPLATSTHSRDSPRNTQRNSSSYSSPRKETSEFGFHGSSSGGSRPSSRPPSTYSVSSEEARVSSARRDSSSASLTGSVRSMNSYLAWTGSNHSLNAVPPMPQLAAFAAVNSDMPLLPPTAPFMKHSRHSSPSPDPNRGSSMSSERRYSSSGSLNSSHRNGSNTSLRQTSVPQPPGSPRSTKSFTVSDPRQSGHVRRSSNDSRSSMKTSATQSRPQPPSAYSQPQVSRGRPPIPSYQSAPSVQSPWTALPTQTGAIPTAMPVSPYSHSTHRSSGFTRPMGHDWRSTLIS